MSSFAPFIARRRAQGSIAGAQRGFSMIEVLIALVVLAVGLLGFALLQTMNLRYTQSANQRTQAINLANELLDIVRANRTEAASYLIASGGFGTVDASAGCNTYTALTAANNLARWKCEVVEALGPQAVAEVTIPAAGQMRVVVTWDESNIGATNGSVELSTQL